MRFSVLLAFSFAAIVLANPIPLEAYKSTLSRRGIKSPLQARGNHATGSVDQITPVARRSREDMAIRNLLDDHAKQLAPRADDPPATDPTATQGSPQQAPQNLGSPDTTPSATSASSMTTDKSSALDPTSSGPAAPPDATNLASSSSGSTAVDPNAKSHDGTEPKETEHKHHSHRHHPHHGQHPHNQEHKLKSKEGKHKKRHHKHNNQPNGQDRQTSPSVDPTAPSGDPSSLKVSPSGPDGNGIPPSDPISGGNAGLKATDPLSGAGAGATGSGGPPTNTPISSPLSSDPQTVASASPGGPNPAVNLSAAKTADSSPMGGAGLSGAAAMSASGTPPPVTEGAPAA